MPRTPVAVRPIGRTLSHAGYAKRQPVTAYRAQRRGGRGRNAAATKDEDFIDQLWLVNTHDTLLTFTSSGRVFWLSVYQLPEAGSNARGRPIINWIPLEAGERVQAVLPVREYGHGNVLFATAKGTVKKTALTEFAYRLARGKIAINLDEGDRLVDVALTDGQRDVMLFASNGKTVRFGEASIRTTGRNTSGVRGIRLRDGEEVVSLIVAESRGDASGDEEEIIDDGVEATVEASGDDAEIAVVADDGGLDILTVTENGYGKRTALLEYPRKGRGTQGVIGIQTSERNGRLVGAVLLSAEQEVLLISDGGTLVRTRAAEISRVSRNTQGVTLMRLGKGEKLQAVEALDASLDEEEEVATDVADAPELQPDA
jgi:DNA gyrase subunit A